MTPEQKAAERFPDMHIPDCPETTQLKMEEVYKQRRAFVLGHREGVASSINTLRQLGYLKAAEELGQ